MTDTHDRPEVVDWQAVWKQLDWEDPQRQQAVLRERLRQRAIQYAGRQEDESASREFRTLLTFKLAAERYGIEVTAVRGVRPLRSITRVQGTPRFYRGVVNIRGQIISVLDMRLFFDMAAEAQELPPELIIVQSGPLQLALLADHVEEVYSLPMDGIRPMEEIRYVRGVTSERLVVLDIEQFLRDERLIIGGTKDE